METHWTNLLYPITAGVIVQSVMAVLRFLTNRKHKSSVLEEEKKQTALLMSIDRRMRGMETFGTLSTEELVG